MTRRHLARIAIAALAVLSLLALAWWMIRDPGANRERLLLHGNVDIRQVQLAFDAQGRIQRLLVEEGNRVEAGELLAVLDTARLEQQVAAAAAEVEAQRQVVAQLEAGSRPEEIRRAEAEVEAARAELTRAQRSYRRLRDLLAQNLTSQEEVDEAQAAADAAAARLNVTREALNLLRAGPRREEIAAARARLNALEAQHALAERQLADATLHAPAAGIIRNRLLEPGDMATPQTPVYTLAITDPLWVRAYVPEPDLGKVQPGMAAAVSTDSFPGKAYRGWIGFISPTAEFTPKSVETEEVRADLVYEVRVHVCNPQGELRLGMPATVVVPLNQPPEPAGEAGCPPQ